jgi:uncharacterized membrane protein
VPALLRTRVTLVWLLLVAATVLSWEMGHGAGFSNLRYASCAIIVVAFVKVRFVIQEFMEIRTAPRFMRAIADVWLLAITAVLVTLYLT